MKKVKLDDGIFRTITCPNPKCSYSETIHLSPDMIKRKGKSAFDIDLTCKKCKFKMGVDYDDTDRSWYLMYDEKTFDK